MSSSLYFTNLNQNDYNIFINGHKASFDHPIQPGDRLEIKWLIESKHLGAE